MKVAILRTAGFFFVGSAIPQLGLSGFFATEGRWESAAIRGWVTVGELVIALLFFATSRVARS